MNLIEQLSVEIKKIDISLLTINDIEEIKLHHSIIKYSRYIGTEFEATLKKIIYYINKIPISNLSYYNLKYISETEVLGEYSGGFERSNYDPDFTIHKFIKYYNFQSSFSYHIENPNEIFEIQKHLNFLLQTIDINLFIAKKIRLGVRIGWIGNNLNEGFADIILDNSLIDIKSGV
jgi:hypothetical protein